MATIESLDLASLQNNPQSIAEALEDALETTDGTIGQLKTDAQSKKDDIDDLYDDALTVKNQIDAFLNGIQAVEQFNKTSLLNSWTAWDLGNTVNDENGVYIQRYGKLYIIQISAYKDTGVGTSMTDTLITCTSSDIKLPSSNVVCGLQFIQNSGADDRTYRVLFNTNGNIDIHFNNHTLGTMYVVGNFIGVDQA